MSAEQKGRLNLEPNKRYNPRDLWDDQGQIEDETASNTGDEVDQASIKEAVGKVSEGYRQLEYYVGNEKASKVLDRLREHYKKFPGLTEADHQILDAEEEENDEA